MIPTINLTDGYKVDHRRQMPKGVVYQLNNFTPRKTRREGVDRIVFFGLQYFIKKYLIEDFKRTFFDIPKDVAVARYKRRIDNYLGSDHKITFEHIGDLHDLGYIPVKIKALPEGSRVNIKVPPVIIESTTPKFVWIVGYLETLFSTCVWGPCTSATTAFEFRKMLQEWSMKTVGNADFVPFQGHDFSFRGLFGVEAAVMSGAAHLLSFVGTDTVPAIDFLEDYYNADSDKELVGCSVAATEHSVMCTGVGLFIYNKYEGKWDRIGDAELDVFRRLVTEVYPDGIISIVSDTFNLWKVLNEFLPALKNEILARNGKVVIRPDSGDPVDILTGRWLQNAYKVNTLDENGLAEIIEDIVREETPHGEHGVTEQTELFECEGKYYWVTHNNITWNRHDKQYYYIEMWNEAEITIKEVEITPEHKGVVESLWNIFGGTLSEKGYKILDSHIGTIYGDSITKDRAIAINQRLFDKGFASINWVAGMGSYLYQYVTRDTDGWAMKATYVEAEIESQDDFSSQGGPSLGETYTMGIEIFKDPITDDGTKKSARGLLAVYKQTDGSYILKDQVTKEEFEANETMELVFRDGVLIKDQSLSEIRARLMKYLS